MTESDRQRRENKILGVFHAQTITKHNRENSKASQNRYDGIANGDDRGGFANLDFFPDIGGVGQHPATADRHGKERLAKGGQGHLRAQGLPLEGEKVSEGGPKITNNAGEHHQKNQNQQQQRHHNLGRPLNP